MSDLTIHDYLGLPPCEFEDSYSLDKEIALFKSVFAQAAKQSHRAVAAKSLEQVSALEKANLKLDEIAANTMSKDRLRAQVDLIVQAMYRAAGQPAPDEELRSKLYHAIEKERNQPADFAK